MTSTGLRLVLVDLLVLFDKTGFDLADHFVLLNGSRLPAAAGVQRRARRAHSNLLIGMRR